MLESTYKDAMSKWASGVAVVTTQTDGLMYGLTVSSFTSVSLTPPIILVCLYHKNRLPSMIEQANCFSVSLLNANQKSIANFFASKGREPATEFPGVRTENVGSMHVPVLSKAMASLACNLRELHIAGDHAIVLGDVDEIHINDNKKKPLVYHSRRFGTVSYHMLPKFRFG